MKLAFVYAGQGSQVVGMGQSFYQEFETAKRFYDQIECKIDIKKLSFEGPIEALSQTQNTQPCMVANAIVVTDLLKASGIEPTMTCGLSLGEYSALYAANVFDQKTVLDIITIRGQAMSEAVAGMRSKMVAIIGAKREDIEATVKKYQEPGVVEVANYNCPGQIVIGGTVDAVDQVVEALKELGVKRAIPLNTSGPFHTSLLKPASLALAKAFETIQFNEPTIPVVFNTTASTLKENQTIASLLEKQVMTSVYFEDSIKYMLEQGIDTIVEIGPGKVLSGFIKKIDKTIKVYQIEDATSLNETIVALKGE